MPHKGPSDHAIITESEPALALNLCIIQPHGTAQSPRGTQGVLQLEMRQKGLSLLHPASALPSKGKVASGSSHAKA